MNVVMFVLLLFLGLIGLYLNSTTDISPFIGSSFQTYHFHGPSYRNMIVQNTENTEKRHFKSSYLDSKDEYNKKYKLLNRNIPIDLLLRKIHYTNPNGCTKFPDLINLRFDNIYWQTLHLKNKGTVYLLSAYYDNRKYIKNSPVIRIISILRSADIPSIKYCQIWFPNEKRVIITKKISAIHTETWSYHIRHYILSCKIPTNSTDKIPSAVSLVESECDIATNALKVHYNRPESGKKDDFAICIKPLFYPKLDISIYIVQYIELAKILGISKVYLYEYSLNSNNSAALNYYVKHDRIQLTPYTMPGEEPNLPSVMAPFLDLVNPQRHMNEFAAHNDCFYMNIHRYKYIAVFDFDEIMIPSNGKSWKEAIEDIIKKEKKKFGNLYKPPTSYHIPMGVFSSIYRDHWISGIPKYMSMLQSVNRNGMKKYYKQLIDTELNLGISIHEQIKCIGKCLLHRLKEKDVFLVHFRNATCDRHIQCRQRITDTRILHYKDDMIKNVKDVLKAIEIMPDTNGNGNNMF